MEKYVWRGGEPPERSYGPAPENIALQEGQTYHNSTALSMGIDNNTLTKVDLALQMAEQNQYSNRRENVNEKLLDRHMIQQVNQNPYFKEANYLNDIDIQESFLRPRSSNTENYNG